jgi:hypothetical protein
MMHLQMKERISDWKIRKPLKSNRVSRW